MALLGPRVRPDLVCGFELPGIELSRATQLTPADKPDAVLIFGGDGTVHRHLRALIEAQTPFLPVPCGSGNDFAVSLGLRSPTDAVKAWRKYSMTAENVSFLDAGLITPLSAAEPQYFCCVAGTGFDSEVNRRANRQTPWLRRHGGYVLAVLTALWSYQSRRIQVSLPSGSETPATEGWRVELDEPALMVAVGNAPHYGAGMRIAHRAVMNDGLLDVCFVRRIGKLKTLRFFPVLFNGGHLGMKEVEYRQLERLRIFAEEPLPLYADGEYICHTPVELTAVARTLKAIVP